jgi:hypothetical protein
MNMDDEQVQTFNLEKFLPWFQKRQIEIIGVWIVDKRVVFIEVEFSLFPCHLFIYVQSKYHFIAEGMLPFNKHRLIVDEEATFPQDSHNQQIKTFLEKMTEHVKNQPIKILYLGNRHIINITRYNEIDAFGLELPKTDTNFHYLTDWEWFFQNFSEAPSICSKIDKICIYSVFETNSVKELNRTIPTIKDMTKKLENWDSKEQLTNHIQRITRMETIQSNSKTIEECKQSSQLRNNYRTKIFSQLCIISNLSEMCNQLKIVLEKI